MQGVAGTWKDLTDNVNLMAGNLTSQVRGIARVVTAVASGDLTRKLTVEAEGEIAALSDTINSMIETLATFADQVTSVALRSRRRRQAGRPGQRARRRRHVEGPHRQRQPPRRQPHDAGARDCRSRHGGHDRRPHAIDSGGSAGRSRRAQGQHQLHDRQPQGHHLEERRAGLAEDQPRQVLAHAAGPARPADRRPPRAVGAGAGRLGPARRALRAGLVGGRRRPAPAGRLRAQDPGRARGDAAPGRGPHRPVRDGPSQDPGRPRAGRAT